MSDKYILKDREPVAVTDLYEWGKWFETNDRVVAKTAVSDLTVSTVFLGLDHRHTSLGRPLLFETMIFGPKDHPLSGWQERSSTWAEAEAQHACAVELAQGTGQ